MELPLDMVSISASSCWTMNDAEGYVIQHEMCKCPSCCRVVDISWIFLCDVVISKIILNVVFSKLHIIMQ